MESRRFQAHPWHGIDIGSDAPAVINAFIEIVPSDTVKYEIDKESGHLKVDRPQLYSSLAPAPYGFIPQTYCGPRIAELCSLRSGKDVLEGDGDPLDICVLSEHKFPHGDILLRAVPIGGLRLIDRKQADDKIIAVLQHDDVYGRWSDISDCAPGLLARLQHYFLTYKAMPGEFREVEIANVYGREEAHEVIRTARADYEDRFPNASAAAD